MDDDEKEKKTVKESYLSDTLAKRPASNVVNDCWRSVYSKQKAMNEVDAWRDHATPTSIRHDADERRRKAFQ